MIILLGRGARAVIFDLWIFLHILCFVVWLGTDVAVFYVSRRIVDSSLAKGTRVTLVKVMNALDLGPRIALVLIPATGLELAAYDRISPVQGPWLIATWAADLAWLALVLTLHHRGTSDADSGGKRFSLARLDLVLRASIAVALVGCSISSLAVESPFGTRWLAAKVGLFGIAVAGGLAIRFTLVPFSRAFSCLVDGGSSPTVERQMRLALAKTTVFVWMIWICILGAAFLGVAQPILWR